MQGWGGWSLGEEVSCGKGGEREKNVSYAANKTSSPPNYILFLWQLKLVQGHQEARVLMWELSECGPSNMHSDLHRKNDILGTVAWGLKDDQQSSSKKENRPITLSLLFLLKRYTRKYLEDSPWHFHKWSYDTNSLEFDQFLFLMFPSYFSQ